MAYAGNLETFRIDLNMLRGDRINARRDFAERADDVLPVLSEGETVRVVEEEGDAYLATVEGVEGLRVRLRLILASCDPAAKVTFEEGV